MLIVRCPRCGKDQKTWPRTLAVTETTKRCVYCGRSFKVHSSLPKSRIIEII
jgi:uncharacterized Zn finger protein